MLVSLIIAFTDICVMDGKDQQLVRTIDTYRNELKGRVSYLGICVRCMGCPRSPWCNCRCFWGHYLRQSQTTKLAVDVRNLGESLEI
jgi:hypothetical protein